MSDNTGQEGVLVSDLNHQVHGENAYELGHTNVVPSENLPEKKELNRLLRIGLINSYPKGLYQLLQIDGNSILTGRNSAGKTSLMGAVAPFYGVSLSDISRKSEAKKSYIDFYLPYSNSYIVYEYIRNDTLCCVLLRRNEGLACFHFISGGYDEDLFVSNQDGKLSIKSFDEIKKSISLCNRKITSQLSQSEYEAIISNRPRQSLKGISNQSARTINNYRGDFSLTSGGKSSFYGFGPIANNVLHSRVEFDEICKFLVEAMRTQGVLNDDNIKIDSVSIDTARWIRQRESWRLVDKLKPSFEELRELLTTNFSYQQSLAESEHAVRNVSTEVLAWLSKSQEIQKLKQDGYEKIKMEMATNEAAWYESKEKLRVDIDTVTTKIANLESDKNAFEQGTNDKDKHKPMFELIRLASQKDALEEQIKDKYISHKQYQEQIQESVNSIKQFESIFNSEKQELRAFKEGEIRVLDKTIDSTKLELSEKLQSIEHTYNREKQDIEDLYSHQKAQLDSSVNESKVSIARLDSDISNSQYSDNYKQEIERNNKNIAQYRADQKAVFKDLSSAENNLSDIKEKINSNIAARSLKQSAINSHQDVIAKKQSLMQGDTLHSFLLQSEANENLVESVNNIKKVISPSLMNNKKLLPRWVDDHTEKQDSINDLSVFGLEINTSSLPESKLESHSEIAQEIIDRERKIQELKEGITALDADTEKLEGRQQQAKTKVAELKIAIEKSESTIDEAEANGNYLDLQAKQDKEQRISTMRQQREVLKSELAKAVSALSNLHASKEQNLKIAINKAAELKAQEVEQQRVRQSSLELDINKANEQYKEKLAEASARKDQAVANNGYDLSVLKVIEDEIKDLDKQLVLAEKAQRRINAFDQFMLDQYPEMEALLSKKKELVDSNVEQQHQHDSYKQKTEKLLQELMTEIEKNSEKISQLKTNKDHLATHEGRIKQVLNKALVNNVNQAKVSAPETVEMLNLLVESILRSAQNNISAAQKSIDKGIKLLGIVKKPFFDNEAMFEAIFSQSEHTSRTTETNWFTQAQLFIDYMDNEHENKKELIIQHYIVEAEKIKNFKDDLDEANRTLKAFIKTINQSCSSICENLNSLAIESFEMSISSRIEHNEWYNTLKNFSNAYSQWQGSESIHNRMPSESILVHLEKVQQDIGQNRLNIKFAEQFSMDLKVKQHGQVARTASRTSSFSSLSSNGTMRIAQLIIYLSLISIISKTSSVELKLFIDEIGVLDAQNTKELIELLSSQQLTAMCAAPEKANDEIIPYFSNNVACSRDNNNVYSLSQTSDPTLLTHQAEMQNNGAFKI